jgi:hypothetical protein
MPFGLNADGLIELLFLTGNEFYARGFYLLEFSMHEL